MKTYKQFKYEVAVYLYDNKKEKVSDIIDKLSDELNNYRVHTENGKILNKEEYKLFILNKIHKLIKYKDLSIKEFYKVIDRGEY